MSDMDNTSGFYRIDGNGDFQWAPNFVHAPTYALRRDDRDAYTYPTEGGWVWFDDEAAAREHFGVPALANPPSVEN
jgi:hypothetical protein